MSIIKHVTLQKIVAHDFRYDPRRFTTFCKIQKLLSLPTECICMFRMIFFSINSIVMETQGVYCDTGIEFFDIDEFQASKHCYMKSFTMCDHLSNAFHTYSYHNRATSCISYLSSTTRLTHDVCHQANFHCHQSCRCQRVSKEVIQCGLYDNNGRDRWRRYG